MEGQSSITIDAPPDKVWGMVSDVTRMGEWSPETYDAEWIDGATKPEVGARFRGRNRRGRMKWSTKCTVTVCEPGREFTFVVGAPERPVTRWSYTFSPSGSGTEATERWESIRYGFFSKLLQSEVKATAALDAGVQETLASLKAQAEAGE